MTTQLIIFMVLFAATVIFSKEKKESSNSILETRKNQSLNLLRENVVKKKIEELTEKRVKPSKKNKIETLCLQAGFGMTYAEYIMLCLICSLVCALAAGIGMSNPLLGLLFLFMGYGLPGQIITALRNRRIELLEKQVGSFMNMSIERYKNTKDMAKSLELTLEEFKGEEPMYSEIKKTVFDIRLGLPVGTSLNQLARRTGNKYVQRFADYYEIVSSVGTAEIRESLLGQAYSQYEEHMTNKLKLKKEIRGPKNDAFTLLGTIPAFCAYQIATTDGYVAFMTGNFVGQIGTLVVCAVFFASLWFINARIGAPIE